MYYVVDTNIWIDLSRAQITCDDLFGNARVRVVLSPFAIIESVRGVVRGGERNFLRNRSMVGCMAKADILELTKVFVFQILWKVTHGVSGVRPKHYKILLDMLTSSNSLSEFLRKTEAPGSVWKGIGRLHSIHESVLNKELGAVSPLANGASLKTLHVHMSRLYELSGLLPDPDAFERTFSAALEFLRSSIVQVRNGANLLKNNRGMYVDNQLFFYLADPEAVIVSNEDFSNEIRVSPQRNRIISYSAFRLLSSAPDRRV